MGIDAIALSDDIAKWAETKWPNGNIGSKLRKLGEEQGELGEAIYNGNAADIIHEAADCMICLAHIIHMMGVSDFLGMMELVFHERMERDK